MVSQGQPLSIRPSDATKGGGLPTDMNLRVTGARFEIWDYGKPERGTQTTAAKLSLVNDDEVPYTQYYSVGDPNRYVPSSDGKTLVPLGGTSSWTESCNFFTLMSEVVNAGFDESKLGSDISALEGLYAYWEGKPQQERKGLRASGEPVGMVLVPTKIHKLPWDTATTVTVTGDAQVNGDLVGKAMGLVQNLLAKATEITRADLAKEILTGSLSKDPQKDEVSRFMFGNTFRDALDTAGFKMAGEAITKK